MEDRLQKQFDQLHRKIFLGLRKGIFTFDKHTDEGLEQLLEHSIRLEEYETSSLIKQEIDKRKNEIGSKTKHGN